MKYKIFVFIREKRKLIQRENSEEAFSVGPQALVDGEEVFQVVFDNLFESQESALDWIGRNSATIADYRLTVLPVIIP